MALNHVAIDMTDGNANANTLMNPLVPAYSTYSAGRLGEVQQEVDETVGVMRDVVSKVLARDQKLTEVTGQAEELKLQAGRFTKTAAKVKAKHWWDAQYYWWCSWGLFFTVLILVILVPILIRLRVFA